MQTLLYVILVSTGVCIYTQTTHLTYIQANTTHTHTPHTHTRTRTHTHKHNTLHTSATHTHTELHVC